MKSANLREKIYDLIDQADDRLLIKVFALINEYYASGYKLSASEKKEIYRRSDEMKSGKVKGLWLEEVVTKAKAFLAEQKKKS